MPIQQKVWKAGFWVAIILGVYLLTLTIGQLKSISYIGSGVAATNTISVDGTGDAVAVPDIATFSFTVTESAKTVADAQTKATTKNNAALKAVRDLGIAEKDIQTTYYSINPQYEYQNAVCQTPAIYNSSGAVTGSAGSGVSSSVVYCPPNKQVLTGYEVSQSTQVKLRDLSKAGTLLTTIGTLGVQNVNGPSFSVDKPETVQGEARAKAIADAQSRAKGLADQLGVKLVRITSFSENNSNYPRPMNYAMGAVSLDSKTAAAAPEISTGEQKVTDTVTITYEIQ